MVKLATIVLASQLHAGHTSHTYRFSSSLRPSKSPAGREVSSLFSKPLSNATKAHRGNDQLSAPLGVAVQLPGLVAQRHTRKEDKHFGSPQRCVPGPCSNVGTSQEPNGHTSHTHRYTRSTRSSKIPADRLVSLLFLKPLSNTTEAQRGNDQFSVSIVVCGSKPKNFLPGIR